MLVKFLKQTRHNNAPAMPGDTADVPSGTVQRWVKNGIAEPIEAPPLTVADTVPDEVPVEQRTVDVLKSMLEENDVRIPHNARRSQLVEMVNNLRKRTQEGGDE